MWKFIEAMRKRFRHLRPPHSFKTRIKPDGIETFKVVANEDEQEEIVSMPVEEYGFDPGSSGNTPPAAHTAVFIEDKPGYKGKTRRRSYSSTEYRDSPPM